MKLAITFLLLLPSALAAAPRGIPDIPDIDKRQGATVSASHTAQVAALKERLPGLSAALDRLTGAPSWVGHANKPLTGKGGRGGVLAERVPPAGRRGGPVHAFFDEYRPLYGHGSEVLRDEDIVLDAVDDNGLHSFVWRQKLDGIPVFDAEVRAHVTRDGEMLTVSGSMVPEVSKAADTGTPDRVTLRSRPKISAAKAVALAADSIGENLAEKDVKPADPDPDKPGESRFTAACLRGTASAGMTWVPIRRNLLKLAWHVDLRSAASPSAYMVVIDAKTGEVLIRYLRTKDAATQYASYRVYASDSPRPMSPGWPAPSTTLPAQTERSYTTLTSLNTAADLNGWIDDGDNATWGNNVRSYYPSDPWEMWPEVLAGSPYRVFDQPLNLTQAPEDYQKASVVQSFFTCNLLHDKLHSAGWTESRWNCQYDNFGRGGYGYDPVDVFVQCVVDNAYCTPEPDGNRPELKFGIFGGTRDSALDAEVVAHEYAHILSCRLAGGSNAWPTAQQTEAMGEGWSDFLGISMFSQTTADNLNGDYGGTYAFGAYSAANYYYGMRRYPYSTNMAKNPLTFKDMWTTLNHPGVPTNPDLSWVTNPLECHNGGEIWCTALWEARCNIIKAVGYTGNDIMMRLVVNGLWVGPSNNPSVIEARNAILTADTQLHGGIYRRELWEAFAKRGLGYSATWGTEAFDIPPLGSACDYPSFSPPGACYTSGQMVTITCPTSGATIRYTLDGSNPTSGSTEYTGPISITSTTTLKARAFKTGLTDSGTRQGYYVVAGVAATPTITPGSQASGTPVLVTIDCATEGATIRYTTNGNEPSTSSTICTGPITVSATTTVKAKAWAPGHLASGVSSATYTIVPLVYVDASASGTHNGQTWATAFVKIQDAINSTSQAEIWVADGVYNELITLKSMVAIYGGFSGNETRRDQRSPSTRITTIDAGLLGRAVYAPSGVYSSAVLDGFRITSGSATSGAGVYCYSSSPKITNNVIESNAATTYGGGIYAYGGVPTLSGNTIRSNTAQYGGGLYLLDTAATTANNFVCGNTATALGGGSYCAGSSTTYVPKVVNNTICGNTAATDGGGGNYCHGAYAPTIANNIVAFNSSGIAASTSAAPVLACNNLYANSFYNYIGLSAGTGDISADPHFADRLGGDYHIRRSSPCVDTGLNTAPGLPATDVDLQSRTNNSAVDIGADESYGETYSVIYRVKAGSPTNGPGSSWSNAYRRILYATDVALPGDEIWVAASTYPAQQTLRDGIGLYGGFAGTETERDRRCPRLNPTILDGNAAGPVVTVESGAGPSTVIDGFTIRNGASPNGGGIFCSPGASPLIQNNIVTGNQALESAGGGIYCVDGAPTIQTNLIYGNTARDAGGGIFCDHASAVIRYNTICGNTANRDQGGGICFIASQSELTGNIVASNTGYGGCFDHSEGPIRFNDFYGNRDADYYGISDQAGRNGNIRRDPLFVNAAAGDYHLTRESQCIDSAESALAPSRDLDGSIRPQDGNSDWVLGADMGAYEYGADFAKIRWDCPSGTGIALSGVVVTATIPDRGLMYIEKPDRSCGMGILAYAKVAEGDVVNVVGKIETDAATGERFLGPESTITKAGGRNPLRPFGMPLGSLAGGDRGLQTGASGRSGLNNTGLLVKVWGKVVAVDPDSHPDWFTIEDGSSTVRVQVPTTLTIDPALLAGQHPYVSVVGISSTWKPATKVLPLIRLRKMSDLVLLRMPPF